jgi:hypothetical protein
MSVIRRALFVSLLLPAAAFAATFVVPSDRAMVARSHAIVRGSVLSVFSQGTAEGGVETVSTVAVDETIKGQVAESVITVFEPGGRLGEHTLIIPGVPHLVPGQEVLLFLRRVPDGWSITDLVLGKFALVRDSSGRALYMREEEELHGWDLNGEPHVERARAAEPFLDFLRKAGAAGAPQPMTEDYFVDLGGTATPNTRPVKPLVSAEAAVFPPSTYTMAFTSNNDPGERWNVFPNAVTWYNQNTLSGAPNGGVDAINTGLAAWDNDSGSNVNYVYGGQNAAASGGLSTSDNLNGVRFEVDLSSRGVPPFTCGSGGTVAIGGFWTTGATHTFSGQSWETIGEGDVDVNKGLAGCSSFTTSGDFLTGMTHELGHTLSFRHSNQDRLGGACPSTMECSSNAVMNSVIVSGLNAVLQTWDIDAVRAVYPGTSPPPCTPPSITTQPLSRTGGGTLSVTASGTATLSYQWYLGVPGDTSQPISGATSASLPVSPARTTSYWVRVTNSCGTVDSAAATVLIHHVPYDFFNDGTSNALLRNNSTNDLAIWEMQGRTLISGNIFARLADANIKVVGVGDFNGDGQDDILFRNVATGLVTVWMMSGRSIIGTANVRTVSDFSWSIAALGDFNRDGRTDIVWYNAGTGDVAFWNMSGGTVLNDAVVYRLTDINWRVQLAADFTGDGWPELLLRNIGTQQMAMWEMSNRTILNGAVFFTFSDSRWSLIAAGDFNGDSKADLLWRHTASGDVAMWEMNGRQITNGNVLASMPDFNWQAEAFGDYDANGRTEVMWRNVSTAQTIMWELNGHQIVNGNFVFTLECTCWQFQPPQKPIPGF